MYFVWRFKHFSHLIENVNEACLDTRWAYCKPHSVTQNFADRKL